MALATSSLVEKSITQAISEQTASATFKREASFQEESANQELCLHLSIKVTNQEGSLFLEYLKKSWKNTSSIVYTPLPLLDPWVFT